MPIPAWNARGVIAPIDNSNPVLPGRSPYVASLVEVIQRFGTTPERCTILQGLLDYRAALQAAGIDSGFQWLDGSFLEDIETIEARAPRDIDVVTYYLLPAGVNQNQVVAANPAIFPVDAASQAAMKAQYHVDGYVVSLRSPPERLVQRAAYWYSMWSHRRDESWKGYVQVALGPAGSDAAALQELNAIIANLAGQQPPQVAANVAAQAQQGAGP